MTKVTKIAAVGVSLMVIALLVMLFARQPAAETQNEVLAVDGCPAPKEIATMDFPEKDTASNVALPPIDASAPAITETATFALG